MLKRAVISSLQPFIANHVYTQRNGPARGLRRRGGLGFLPRFAAMSLEERFLQTLNLEGKTVYDVGGYEGVLTLFFASRVGPSGRLITFEPNPRSCARIRENVRLNGFTNVDVRQLGLGARAMRASLVFPADEAARGSLVADIQDQIRHEKSASAIEIDIDSLDHQIELGLPHPDFVKIDVEGLELDVLEGMKATIGRRRPTLHIEIHGATPRLKLENVTAVIEFLWRHGYKVFHVESAQHIESPSRFPEAMEGHLYCS